MKIALIDESIPTQLPSYATTGSAGLDLYATSKVSVPRTLDEKKKRWVGGYIEYGTNIAVEILDGFVGLLVPKSSSRDYSQTLANDLGVIDEDYRGELKFSYVPNTGLLHYTEEYQVGDQIGQLLLVACKRARVHHVSFGELSVTERGAGGHGSTENLQRGIESGLPETEVEDALNAETRNLSQDAPAQSEDGSTPENTSKPATAPESPIELPDLTQGGEVLEDSGLPGTEHPDAGSALRAIFGEPAPTEAVSVAEDVAETSTEETAA